MPGFNQRGPLHEGAMTGRGLGRCAASIQDVGGVPDTTWNGPGYGCGGGREMGRGRCRRSRWGVDTTGDDRVTRPLQPARQETLGFRVHQLESELEAIKNQLKQVDNQ